MIARICTTLPQPPDQVWLTLLQRDAFLYITRGMLAFRGAEQWPELFYEGQVVETRLLVFNFIPAWKHRLNVVRIDHDKRELASQEAGGLITRWNHRKWVEKGSGQGSLYTDEIDIDAGWLTFFVWLYAHIFYRYRQRRMRKYLQINSA
ncbi:MAG: hypothetical protein KJP04_01535 [Arenicella sp.]|nr:hypothetical protein [Arenicella sp.]